MRVLQHGRRAVEILFLVAAVMPMAGCFGEPTEPPQLSYRLEWDFAGVVRDYDDQSWTVTNNEGYEVTVTRGYLVTHSIAFLPCRIADRRRSVAFRRSFVSQFARLLSPGPRQAHANHGDLFVNPVQTPLAFVESLTSGEPRDAGSFEPEDLQYCQVHYVLARARKNSLGLPDDIDMVGATAHVEGFYRRQADGTKSPFTIHSPSANAVRTDVIHSETGGVDVEPGVDGHSVRARAIITRRVASLFKDIDFKNDGKHKIPWQFLKNAADSTTIRVEFTSPLEEITR